LGADVSTFTGVAPKPGLSVGVFTEVRGHTLSLDAELAVGASNPADQLQVVMGSAAVAPCVRFGPTFICALGEAGWLQAWSLGAARGSSDGAPFVTVGGRGGAEIPLSTNAFVRLQGDLRVEVYGPRFAVPEQTYAVAGMVYAAPRSSTAPSILGGAVGIGFGAYFR
jgi:hypothetical protein